MADPRIQRLIRAADAGDQGAAVALEAELLRVGRPARSNADRDAALHESRSAGAYYAAMLLDALREAQTDGWWAAAGAPRPWPPTHETRALLNEPNDLLIERINLQRPRDRSTITLVLPDGLGHPRFFFHEKRSPGSYMVEGEWVHHPPSYPPECMSRWGSQGCQGHVYGGIRLSVKAVYSNFEAHAVDGVEVFGWIVRHTVKIESRLSGPYFLAQQTPSYTPRPGVSFMSGWSDAKFLRLAEESYCQAYERLQLAAPSYRVLVRFEKLRDEWAAAEGGSESDQRKRSSEIYDYVLKAAHDQGLPPAPYHGDRIALLTPEQAYQWDQHLDEIDRIFKI